jgi:hypothetical protein
MVSGEWIRESPPMKVFTRRRTILLLSATVLLCLGAGAYWYFRGRNSPPIAPRGGEPFQNFAAIATPFFLQRDERWKDDKIGGSGETLARVGCAACSLAMALHGHGFSPTPKALNDWLKANEGYNPRGWLRWEAVSRFTGGKVVVEILKKPSHADIDAALKNKQPVLAKVFIKHVVSHWVLIVGKDGREYLIRDPLGDGANLRRLSEYESDVYGVRIVRPATVL